jgi:hypothetical protein
MRHMWRIAAPVSRAARLQGAAVRWAYARALPVLARMPVAPAGPLDCDVYAFSGQRHLPEQVASVRSLLRHAGRPASFTIVSDGTHDRRARHLLRALDPAVRVVDLADVLREALPRRVRHYARRHAMGRKLALELSLPVDGRPALYADADVLFLRGARTLAPLLAGSTARAAFLVDEEAYLDRRLSGARDLRAPVNGGFFVLSRPLAWGGALERLATLNGPYDFHTEQTVLHLAMHASGARPLDRRCFVVATDDMRRLRDAHAHPAVVLRHYTTPVRHKLWCRVGAGSLAVLPSASR